MYSYQSSIYQTGKLAAHTPAALLPTHVSPVPPHPLIPLITGIGPLISSPGTFQKNPLLLDNLFVEETSRVSPEACSTDLQQPVGVAA